MSDTFKTSSPEETFALGVRLGRDLNVGDCLTLIGDLGAGKTALTRGLAEGFGAEAAIVSSPTYVLMQEYPVDEECSLFHLDLYRMVEPDAELSDLGLEEMLSRGAAVIEWADRASEVLPRQRLEMKIRITGPETREFTLQRLSALSE